MLMYYLIALQNKIQSVKMRIRRLFGDEQGQTMTEYGLLILLIALALIAVIFVFSGQIAGLFTRAGQELQNTPSH